MKITRDGKLIVDTEDCPDCACYDCKFRCYERDAMNLHTQEQIVKFWNKHHPITND